MKVRTILASSAFVAASALSGAAMAQGYIGASIGQSDVDIDCSGTTSCDTKDTAYKIFGGYMFTPNFGIEGGYYDQGKVTQTATDAVLGNVRAEWKGSGFALFGVAAMPIDNFSLFGKLGFASVKVKLNATSSTLGSASASETNTNVAWGLGAGYNFTKNLAARVEFERFRVEFEGEKNDADLISLGISYRF